MTEYTVTSNVATSELVCRTKDGGAGPPGVGSRPAQGYQRGQDLCDGERRGPGPSRGEQGKAREKRRCSVPARQGLTLRR